MAEIVPIFKKETAFTKWVCQCLEKAGAEIMPIVGSQMQGSGWPDRYVSHVDLDFWFEAKRDSNTLRTNQKIKIQRFNSLGTPAMILHYFSDNTMNLWLPNDHNLDGKTWGPHRELFCASPKDVTQEHGRALLSFFIEGYLFFRDEGLIRMKRSLYDGNS